MTERLYVETRYGELHIESYVDREGDVGIDASRGPESASVHINKQHAVDIIKHLTEVFDL